MDQAEITLITAAVGSTTALLGAFGGAFLANSFAEKRLAKQIEHEQIKEKRNLLKQKGEEAYFTLKNREQEFSVIYTMRIAYLQSKLSVGTMNKQIEDFVSPHTQLKLDTLIELYFNELSGDLEEIRNLTIKMDNMFKINAGSVGHFVAQKIGENVTVGKELFEAFSVKLRLAITSI